MAPHRSVPYLITTWFITLLLALGLSRHALGAAHSDPNWGLSGVRIEVAGLSQFAKWLEEAEPDQVLREARPRLCNALSAKSCGLADFGDFLVRLRSGDRWTQIERVNRYVNGIAYRSDLSNWGRNDRWVSPSEFFARGGDCEDYAIAKYFALRSLGISKDDLRILIVWDRLNNRQHAVLLVNTKGEHWFLDSRRQVVRPWKDAEHYQPLYSVHDGFLWFLVPTRANT